MFYYGYHCCYHRIVIYSTKMFLPTQPYDFICRLIRSKFEHVSVVWDNLTLAYSGLFSWHYNPLWSYFQSPIAGFSLLVFSRFLDHTQRRATVGRTPLDEWSIRRRDLYLTTHNTHNRQTSMPLVVFQPTISAGERPKTYALDRTATGTGAIYRYAFKYT